MDRRTTSPGAERLRRCPPAATGRESAWPLVLLASILVVVILASQLPSPLYVLYAERLGLGATAITVLFAAYALGVLLTLLTCGHLSDRLGRRPVIAIGLGIVLLSDVAFVAGADHYGLLLAGRFLCGIAVALLTGAAAAGMVEAAPERWRARAGQLSGVATILGGGAGALAAGAIAAGLARPTTTAFVVHAALVVLAGIVLLRVRETVSERAPAWPTWPRVGVPAGQGRAFATTAAAGFCGFAVLGLVSALTGTFLRAGLGERSLLLAGAVPCLMAAAALVVPPLFHGRVRAARLQRLGLLGLVPGLALQAIAIEVGSLGLYLAAIVVIGAAFGSAFQGALGRLHQAAGHGGGAALFSAFYVAAYLGMMLPVIGEGLLADRLDLTTTVALFGAMIASLAVAAAWFDRDASEPASGPA